MHVIGSNRSLERRLSLIEASFSSRELLDKRQHISRNIVDRSAFADLA